MKKEARLFIACLFICGMTVPVFASDFTGDPNAKIRKLTATGQDPALAEYERVKRLNNDAAITHWTGVIQKDSKSAEAYAKRGKAYGANKDYEKALSDYDMAIQLNSKASDAYIGRAVARFFKDDYEKSWEDVHQAEALGGEFWPAFMDALKKKSGREK